MSDARPITPAPFDAATYKATTRAQWDAAAKAWDAWGDVLRRWLGDATTRMLDMAHVRAGSRVLDVAAGAGDQTLAAAERVGPTGYVLATDISPEILRFAAANAERAGVAPGDVVIAVNGTPVANVDQMRGLVDKSGKSVALLIQRGDDRIFVPVRVG